MLQSLVLNVEIVQHITPGPVATTDSPFATAPSVNYCSTYSMSMPAYPPGPGIPSPYPPAVMGGSGGDGGGAPYPPAGPPGPGFGFPQPAPMQPQQQPRDQAEPGAPTAPPMSDFGQLPAGYEGSGYDRRPIPPPTAYPEVPSGPSDSASNPFVVPQISEADVIEALKDHVNNKCCWGSGAIEDLKVSRIEMSSSYHYHLDTFTEKRETEWTFEPYNSAKASGPPPGYFGMGAVQPPSPWSIDAHPDKEWQDHERKIEVPNTAMVRACHGRCGGSGRMQCSSCNGRGNDPCTWCNGTGRRSDNDGTSNQCTTCMGSGRKKCYSCSGDGLKTCDTCKGHGNVKFFVQLHVKWDNHDENFVSDVPAGFKKKYIKSVDGRIAVQDENVRVFPISSFPDRKVADASKELIDRHNKDFPMERIMKQRQWVKVVPIATVHFDYKDTNGVFFVYGTESDRGVYFKDYPNRVCYCCSIL